ncbi:MAG: porin [Polyangiales bacterium]
MRFPILGLSIAAVIGVAVPAFAVTPNASEAPEEVTVEAPAAPSSSVAPVVAPPSSATAPAATEAPKADPRKELVISGYAQGQYEHHQDSEDELRQGGALQNQNRFLIRRGRLKAEREWTWSSLMLEIDGNTTNGPDIRLHHAEASVLYRGNNPIDLPPMVRVTIGLFDVPFGYELVESPRTRPFMERSLASRSFFPIEPDLGLRVSGALGWLRYGFALINGEPLSSGNKYGWRDPNSSKDWVVRVGGVAQPSSTAEIAFGASFYNGTGFTPGRDATKNTVIWKDANENGVVDGPSELQGQPGQAGIPSRSFDRWMVGADLQVRFRSRLGSTRIYGEAYMASDMDRGLFVADPNTAAGIKTREVGYYAAITQEIGPHCLVGFRSEFYDPNADYLEKQAGKVTPTKQSIRIWSPMVAVMLDPKSRLIFQYDAIRDHFGRNERGVPNDLRNDTWTLRLQVEL